MEPRNKEPHGHFGRKIRWSIALQTAPEMGGPGVGVVAFFEDVRS